MGILFSNALYVATKGYFSKQFEVNKLFIFEHFVFLGPIKITQY